MYGRARVGELEVAFDDQGHGPAVVMLHPFPFDSRVWTDSAREIADAGHRVLTIDYPGFGDSPPPRWPVSIVDLAELLEGLLDGWGIQNAALVGLSMGGYVALAFSRRAPQRLWALVLADTRASADSPSARQGRADALRAIQEHGVDGYLQQSLPRLLSHRCGSAVLSHAISLAEKREETLNAGIATLRDRPDGTAALGAIRCPTFVIAGSDDQVTPPDEMRAMSAAIPGATFRQIPSAGHLANLEAPAAFNDAVSRFLREVASPPAPAPRAS